MHAYVVIKTKNGYTGSYLNTKGGLHETGQLLYKFFRQRSKVIKLMALGDLQQLGRTLNKPTVIAQYGYRYDKAKPYYDLTAQERNHLMAELSTSTISFTRDRGDSPQPAWQWRCRKELIDEINSPRSLIKVPIYLYENHHWYFTRNHNFRILRKKDWSN